MEAEPPEFRSQAEPGNEKWRSYKPAWLEQIMRSHLSEPEAPCMKTPIADSQVFEVVFSQ